MVSQPTMRRIPGITFCLLGLTAALVLFAACGQNEGGRCQIDSDCGSGLSCIDGATGNGTCKYPIAQGTADAALKSDSAVDVPVQVTSEAGTEATPAPELDADILDAGAVDSDSVDLTAID
jgi:hypothetical protein